MEGLYAPLLSRRHNMINIIMAICTFVMAVCVTLDIAREATEIWEDMNNDDTDI